MRINKRIVIDMATYKVLERESYEYSGSITLCCGGGPGGDGGSAAGIASAIGEGDIAGAAPAGETASPEAAGMIGGMGPSGGTMSGPGTAANVGLAGGSPQVSFSKAGMEIGMAIGSVAGIPGSIVGGLIGGIAESAIAGSGVPGGADMSGDPTGGNAIGGPGPGEKKKRAVAGITKKTEAGTPSLKDVTKGAKDDEEKKARKRPQTILTSPLGLRSRPTIRRATLLGG